MQSITTDELLEILIEERETNLSLARINKRLLNCTINPVKRFRLRRIHRNFEKYAYGIDTVIRKISKKLEP